MINELEINFVYWQADNIQTKEDANSKFDLELTDEQFEHIQAKFKEWEKVLDKTMEEAEQRAKEYNEEAYAEYEELEQAAKLKAAAIAKQETDAEGLEDPDDYEEQYQSNYDEALEVLEAEYEILLDVNFRAAFLPVYHRTYVIVWDENKYGDLESHDPYDDSYSFDYYTSKEDVDSWEITFDENGIDVC